MDEGLRFDTLAVHSHTGHNLQTALESRLAGLEGGAWALTFGSGSSALGSVLRLLNPGDRVVLDEDVTGTNFDAFSALSELGIEIELRDLSDPQQWRFRRSSLVFLETPSTTLRVISVHGVAQRAHEVGALVVVDNSLNSPAIQRPFKQQADLVLYSNAAQLCGQAINFGAIIGQSKELLERLSNNRARLGAEAGILETQLLLAGLESLSARSERCNKHASELAKHLGKHKAVRELRFVGQETHRGHSVAARQMQNSDGQTRFGALIAVGLNDAASVNRALASLRVVRTNTHAFGGNTSHARSHEEWLLLSVGLEDVIDLWNDLTRALDTGIVQTKTPVHDDAPKNGQAHHPEPANGDPTSNLDGAGMERYAKLRGWRDTEATKNEISKLAVASNALLAEIAKTNPKDLHSLAKLRGMGEERSQKYGPEILNTLGTEISIQPEPEQTSSVATDAPLFAEASIVAEATPARAKRKTTSKETKEPAAKASKAKTKASPKAKPATKPTTKKPAAKASLKTRSKTK